MYVSLTINIYIYIYIYIIPAIYYVTCIMKIRVVLIDIEYQ